MRRTPPDILITTPESLYLMITSQAREILTGVEAVIVDEIHAVAQSKRGSHLALTLERLSHLVTERGQRREPQRIGLSATQRPLERIAEFLVGPKRECEIVDAGVRKELDLEIVVPVEDMTEPGVASPRPTAAAGDGRGDCRTLSGPHRPGADRGVARSRHQPALDLAGDLPRAAEARPRAHLDDHLRQQPPRRRAPREAPQRAPQRASPSRSSRRPSTAGNEQASKQQPSKQPADCRRSRRSPAPTTARSPTRSGPSSRSCSSRASCPASSPPRRSSSGSTWAPSTW